MFLQKMSRATFTMQVSDIIRYYNPDEPDMWKQITKAVPYIFRDFPIWNESHRQTLCEKILQYYYEYEIGFQTVQSWIFHLNENLNRIMPYYNALALTQLSEISDISIEDLINDTDFTDIFNRKYDETRDDKGNTKEEGTSSSEFSNTGKVEGTSSSEAQSTSSNDFNGFKLHSDEPQVNFASGTYARDYASMLDEEENNSNSNSSGTTSGTDNTDTTSSGSDSGTSSKNTDTTANRKTDGNVDEWRKVQGRRGSFTIPSVLAEAQKIIYNIDSMITMDLKKNFMGLIV